jgi:hypothetical protein
MRTATRLLMRKKNNLRRKRNLRRRRSQNQLDQSLLNLWVLQYLQKKIE